MGIGGAGRGKRTDPLPAPAPSPSAHGPAKGGRGAARPRQEGQALQGPARQAHQGQRHDDRPKGGSKRSRRGGSRRSSGRSRRPAVAGAMMLIGGAVMALFAVIGLAISFGGVIDATFMNLAFTTPDFDYVLGPDGEEGNATFDVYVLMRNIAAALIAIVLIYGGVARVFESADLGVVNQGTSNRLFSKSVIFILVIFVFPPMWDGLSDVGDNLALWVANPLYTFDDDSPCPDTFYDDPGLWFGEYHSSPYITWADKRQHSTPPYSSTGDGRYARTVSDEGFERLCRPELRINYVFGQMLRNTEVQQMRDEFGLPALNATTAVDTSWTDGLGAEVLAGGVTGMFTNLFLGLTKALVAIQVLILTILFGVMTDMLVHMVIAGLPIFLVLSVLPYCDRIFTKFVEAVPALLLIPLMSAVIMSVGAAAIAEAPSSSDGSPYTDPSTWASSGSGGGGGGAGEAGALAPSAMDHVYTWITSLGVVFFAITLPLIMVPMIGSSYHMAQSVVSSAVMSSSMIAGSAATGAASSLAQSRGSGAGMLGRLGGAAMGMGTGMVGAMGSTSMPMPGMASPSSMAQQMARAHEAVHGGDSAEATRKKMDSYFDKSAGKSFNPGVAKAIHDGSIGGGGQGYSGPRWNSQMTADQNADNFRNYFNDPKYENPNKNNERQPTGFIFQQNLGTGHIGSLDASTITPWRNAVGDKQALLMNPELSTSELNRHTDAAAKSLGDGANKAEIRNRLIWDGMQHRGLDPENADHKRAFLSDLKANDAAIKERGGPGYENGEWWKAGEGDGGHIHSGEWDNTRRNIPEPTESPAKARYVSDDVNGKPVTGSKPSHYHAARKHMSSP